MSPPDDKDPGEAGRTTLPEPSRSAVPAAAAIRLLPADPANQQRAVAALFIAILSLTGLLALNDVRRGVYVAAFALLAGVVALWLGLGSLVRARTHHTMRPRGSVTATVIAAAGIVLSALILITFAVLGQQLSSYGRCLSGANTVAAQQSCQNQFTHAVSRKIAVLRSGGK